MGATVLATLLWYGEDQLVSSQKEDLSPGKEMEQTVVA